MGSARWVVALAGSPRLWVFHEPTATYVPCFGHFHGIIGHGVVVLWRNLHRRRATSCTASRRRDGSNLSDMRNSQKSRFWSQVCQRRL